MSENGLWTIDFLSTINLVGSGVLIMNHGRILGGDEGFYYAGSYNTSHNEIFAEIKVTRFKSDHISVFGNIGQFTLDFKGTLQDRTLEGRASVKTNPTLKIQIKGTKKEEL